MKIKKTLLVTLDFYPSFGGVATYWRYLSEQMGSGWVVLAPEVPNSTDDVLHPSYQLYRRRLVSSWGILRWLPMLWHIWRIAVKERPSVIVVGQLLPVGTAVWLLSFVLHIPYVVSTHGMDVLLPMRSLWKQWLCTKIFQRATKVLTVSAYTASRIGEYGVGSDKISLLPGCPAMTMEEVDTTMSFEKAWPALLTVGRLVQRKGHEDVLRALPEVLGAFPDLRYVIVGDGPYRVVLENIARDLGVSNSVDFVGAANDEERSKWLATCDVFVMTPRDIDGDVEGFGLVYLEANLFGKPVIASRSGGITDAVVDGETGILVDEGDVGGIVQAILALLQDPSLSEKLGRQGRERVLQEFTWEKQGEKLAILINNL